VNGESVFGWIKVSAVLIIGAVLALILWKGAAWAKEFFKFGGAFSQNPLAKATNNVATAISGRDETAGGLLAEWFDPATRAFNASMKRTPVKPVVIGPYIGDLPPADYNPSVDEGTRRLSEVGPIL
jgi:hypothetical protein